MVGWQRSHFLVINLVKVNIKRRQLSTSIRNFQSFSCESRFMFIIHCLCLIASEWAPLYIYSSTFRHRRHYVFGLSVRPSVRPTEAWYPPSTCTWFRWSIRPTVTGSRPVRPSFRVDFWAVSGERIERIAWKFVCWCILTPFRTV